MPIMSMHHATVFMYVGIRDAMITRGDEAYLAKVKKRKGWYKRHRNRIKWKWFNKGIEYPTHEPIGSFKREIDKKIEIANEKTKVAW